MILQIFLIEMSLFFSFKQCRQKAGDLGKFQLRDTVVLPFQRIVKYSLLLHVIYLFI